MLGRNLAQLKTLLAGLIGLTLATLCVPSCGPALPEDVEAALATLDRKIDYNLDIKPLLSDRCFACHGPDEAKREAGLRLDIEADATGTLPENPGHFAIRPGDLSRSEAVHRILSSDPESMMPPPESNLSLNVEEKALLIKWIDEGAEYKPHWAFTPPAQPRLPSVQQTDWPANPIDHFILANLEQKNLQPSPTADRQALLRRLSFDLTGLPPTLDQWEQWQQDSGAEALDRLVDAILDRPAYGERMATEWLDVARYADTHGYTVDRYRDMSPWRDWVIKAFNQNMPYDQFVTWQLAGDLMENPSRDQIIATAFNRNHQQNMEGGIIDEEFRVEYVADRTSTLGTAFMGLTLNCARCHDHKYDPVSQQEFYQLFDFFNRVNEAGQIDFANATPVPTLLLTTPEVDSITKFLDQQIEAATAELSNQDIQTKEFSRWLEFSRPKLTQGIFNRDLQAHFPLDRHTRNLQGGRQGVMRQAHVKEKLLPKYQSGREDSGLFLDGDAWLDLGPVGVFDRHDPFTISLWVNLPQELENGVIFHKGDGAALYNFRGYHLALKDNRLELLMACTTPNNAIIKYVSEIPREQWVHLAYVYDGLGKADGLQLFINGDLQDAEVEVDNLYRSILFNRSQEPGLQLGARWRGIGVRGAGIDEVKVYARKLSEIEIIGLINPSPLTELIQQPTPDITSETRQLWQQFYLQGISRSNSELQKQRIAFLQRKASILDTVQELMVMEEMTQPRASFVLDRGQYNARTQPVTAGTPASILPMDAGLPQNRLGLAKWLFDSQHPLTARVAVNRYWQMLMGRGIVETAEDFGNQGALPSHPQLLDWLAVFFRDSGWDIKALLKMIVSSRTYQQQSMADQSLHEIDPDNIWYARGPSSRLSAEMLRDQALAASGLLQAKIGGPSVYPYQPKDLWRVNGGTYPDPTPDQVYRRSLYTIWKRSVPHPTLSTFDAPERSECQPRRQRTNTPLQSLVLMNDPTFVEASRMLGGRMVEHGFEKTLPKVFYALTGRAVLDEEKTLLEELFVEAKENFEEHPNKLEGWLNVGLAKVGQEDKVSLGAATVVANTIINMDASMVKR